LQAAGGETVELRVVEARDVDGRREREPRTPGKALAPRIRERQHALLAREEVELREMELLHAVAAVQAREQVDEWTRRQQRQRMVAPVTEPAMLRAAPRGAHHERVLVVAENAAALAVRGEIELVVEPEMLDAQPVRRHRVRVPAVRSAGIPHEPRHALERARAGQRVRERGTRVLAVALDEVVERRLDLEELTRHDGDEAAAERDPQVRVPRFHPPT